MIPTDQITAPVNEFSRLSGLGISTIWNMVRSGELDSITIGRRRLVVIDSYRKLVERQQAEAHRKVANPPLGRGRQPRRSKPEQTISPN
jgi:hypothetical protein